MSNRKQTMKRRVPSCAGLLLLFWLCAGLVPGHRVPERKYEIRLSLPVGRHFDHLFHYKTNMVYEREGSRNWLMVEGKFRHSYEVTAATDTDVDLTLKWTELYASVLSDDGLNITFNSNNQNDEFIATRIMRAMIGVPVKVRLETVGLLHSVSGIEALAEAADRETQNDQSPMVPDYLREMKATFGEELIRENIYFSLLPMPGKPVSKGEKWNCRHWMKSAIAFELKHELYLQDLNAHSFLVSTDFTVNSDSATVQSVGEMKGIFNVKGTGHGYFFVDRETGEVHEGKLEFRAEGVLHQEANDQLDAGDIPVSFSSVMKFN